MLTADSYFRAQSMNQLSSQVWPPSRETAWCQRHEAAGPPDAQGRMRIRLPIESVDNAALRLLGVGPEVEVLAPASLRRRVEQLARKIVALSRRRG